MTRVVDGLDGRPVVYRHAARVVLVDPWRRVLLFQDSDPLAEECPTFWLTPGGAVDPGETLRAAAIREVAEETGHLLTPAALTGPVTARRAVHGHADIVMVQRETYFVAEVPAFEVDTSGHTEDERRTLLGHHWWSQPELASTEAVLWPSGLAAMVDAILNGSPPGTVPDGQESTVPVDDPAALLNQL